MPLVSAGPLRGRIGSRDELWYRLARRAPGRFVQRVEVLADGSPCCVTSMTNFANGD
jgi:hypothetical protein